MCVNSTLIDNSLFNFLRRNITMATNRHKYSYKQIRKPSLIPHLYLLLPLYHIFPVKSKHFSKKFYIPNIILHTTMLETKQTTSANSAQPTVWRVFLTPTAPKYTAIV